MSSPPAAGIAEPAAPGRPPPARRGYLVPGLIALAALAALALLINFFGLTHRQPSALDGPAVATLVSQGLQASEATARPPVVTCPPSEATRAGTTFRCAWHDGAHVRPIEVTATGGGNFHFQVLTGRG